MTYRINHSVDKGIERIDYIPDELRFETPLMMQHGMWHGAWCWRAWQELFAEWGWMSRSYSLPGHGGSVARRHHRWCTLQYYYRFLVAEIERMPRPPVLLGHSMGGALTQWHLKRCDLPAAVLVASWPARSLLATLLDACIHIPVSVLLSFATLSATPVIRTPRAAVDYFLTEGALLGPEEFHAKLSPESLLVILQYAPPFWKPPLNTKTPLLWIAGTGDATTPEHIHRASAAAYGAEYRTVAGAGHDLMLDRRYRAAAEAIHAWMVKQGIH
jgi:pimeloyl-ACP methyl ester carboxylesterase